METAIFKFEMLILLLANILNATKVPVNTQLFLVVQNSASAMKKVGIKNYN